MRPSLREQKKIETRRALLTQARELFTAKGFDATTIGEVCEGARVSRRTFFRYFPDKQSLVFPNHTDRLERFRAFLENREDGETVFSTLRRATRIFSVEYTEHRDSFREIQAIIESSQTLLAREREIDREWELVLEDAFTEEAGGSTEARRRALVLAGATIGVIRATMRYWFNRDDDEDLRRLGLVGLDCLERGFAISGPAAPR